METGRNKINAEELEKIITHLRDELDNMYDFENKLQQFDKKTLCLFITFVVDHQNFDDALEIIERLELNAAK